MWLAKHSPVFTKVIGSCRDLFMTCKQMHGVLWLCSGIRANFACSQVAQECKPNEAMFENQVEKCPAFPCSRIGATAFCHTGRLSRAFTPLQVLGSNTHLNTRPHNAAAFLHPFTTWWFVQRFFSVINFLPGTQISEVWKRKRNPEWVSARTHGY